jgi:hypothetical protein
MIGDEKYSAPTVYGDQGGTPQRQGSADPNLMLVAMTDSWEFVTTYLTGRTIQYILVYANRNALTNTGTNYNPLSSSPLYDVYEHQSNPTFQPDPHTPCGQANNLKSEPCDGFDDLITPITTNDPNCSSSSCPPQTSTQTFSNGINRPGQRQYGVRRILRRVARRSYCQLLLPEVVISKAKTSQPLLAGFQFQPPQPPNQEIYLQISYYPAPYMGTTNDMTTPSCASFEMPWSLGF